MNWRMLKGGSYRNDSGFLRTADRRRFVPAIRIMAYGFRLCVRRAE